LPETFEGKVRLKYYRPVPLLSLAFDYRFWKLRPFGYRLTNIFLHAINCLLIYIFLSRLFLKKELSLLTSFFFCLLPVNQWVIHYISCRSDLLQTFFMLSSLIFLLIHLKEKKRSAWVLSILIYVLAFLSREMALVFPMLTFLVGYVFCRNKRKALVISTPFLLTTVSYLILRMFFVRLMPQLSSVFAGAPLVKALWGLRVINDYIFALFIPWSFQGLLFSGWYTSIGKSLISFLLICFLVFYLVRLQDKEKKDFLLFGSLWILANTVLFVFMLPQFDVLGKILSEHYLYFASIGFALILATFTLKLSRLFKNAFIVTVCIFYSLIIFTNNVYLLDERTFIREEKSFKVKAVSIYPSLAKSEPKQLAQVIQEVKTPEEKGNACIQLARIYMENGDHSLALDLLGQAKEFSPKDYRVYKEEGIVYFKKRDYKKAREKLSYASFLNPQDTDILLSLAISHLHLREIKSFTDTFREVLKIESFSSYPYRFVASEMYNNGAVEDALLILKESLRIFPEDIDTLIMLGKISYNIGEKKVAYQMWQNAADIYPAHEEAISCLRAIKKEN